MAREELAATLFRITRTETKMKNEGLRSQNQLESGRVQRGSNSPLNHEEQSEKFPELLPKDQDMRKSQERGELSLLQTQRR